MRIPRGQDRRLIAAATSFGQRGRNRVLAPGRSEQAASSTREESATTGNPHRLLWMLMIGQPHTTRLSAENQAFRNAGTLGLAKVANAMTSAATGLGEATRQSLVDIRGLGKPSMPKEKLRDSPSGPGKFLIAGCGFTLSNGWKTTRTSPRTTISSNSSVRWAVYP